MRGRGALAARGAPAKRGGPAPARGGKAAPPAAKAAPAPAAKEEPKEEAKEESAEAAKAEEKPPKPAPINRKSYLPRLGLARAHRLNNAADKAHKFYDEVIKMNPELHDAYIEAAEMLVKVNPVAAVDIYCRFPVDESALTFDDAYIFGEIVQILTKHDKFDDPRLPKFMIKWGKVLGLGILEKYIGMLEAKGKYDVCKTVFAGVNGKAVDDPDLQPFFTMKCWI